MSAPDPLNWERSGGAINIWRRRLHHFTIRPHRSNGCFVVIDDRTGQTASAGFKSPEHAVSVFASEDYRRTWHSTQDQTDKLRDQIANGQDI